MAAIDTYELRTIVVEIFDGVDKDEVEVHVTFKNSGRQHKLVVTIRELSAWERTLIGETIPSQVFTGLVEYYADLVVNPMDDTLYEDALIFLGEMKYDTPSFFSEDVVDDIVQRYRMASKPLGARKDDSISEDARILAKRLCSRGIYVEVRPGDELFFKVHGDTCVIPLKECVFDMRPRTLEDERIGEHGGDDGDIKYDENQVLRMIQDARHFKR